MICKYQYGYGTNTAYEYITDQISNSVTLDYAQSWRQWCNHYTSTTTSTVWKEWIIHLNTTASQIIEYTGRVVNAHTIPAPAEPKITAAEQQVAEKKAEELLLSALNTEQATEYKEHKCFHVQAKSGTRYRINYGRTRNIRQIDAAGKEVRGYCIHPRTPVPVADVLLAQKLMLEDGEQEFLAIANAFSVN